MQAVQRSVVPPDRCTQLLLTVTGCYDPAGRACAFHSLLRWFLRRDQQRLWMLYALFAFAPTSIQHSTFQNRFHISHRRIAATRFQLSKQRKSRQGFRGTHLPLVILRLYMPPPHHRHPCRLSLSRSVLARHSSLPLNPPNKFTRNRNNDERLHSFKLYKIDSHARLEEQPMMHDRVHPAATSSDFSGEMNHSARSSSDPSSSPLYSFHFEKSVPPPPPHAPPPPAGTYVVQVPKDKVFRVPPPENARLLEHYTRRAKRRRGCSCLRVCLYLCAALAALLVLLAAAAAVAYLVFQPRRPAYALQSLAVSGLGGVGNASAAPGALAPEFDATVRADNPNTKIGVQYEGAGSRIAVSYSGVLLASGAWPAFYQGPGNVTVFVARAKGAGLRFSEQVLGQMAAAKRLRSVPFDVDIEVPLRLKLGGVKTWAVPVRVLCTVTVDRLAADAKVVSRSCDAKLPFLFWKK